jgi:hypothetical protein
MHKKIKTDEDNIEKNCLLGLQSGESLMFQRNICSPSSRSNAKQSKKLETLSQLLASFLLYLLFSPEHRDYMFLQNVRLS